MHPRVKEELLWCVTIDAPSQPSIAHFSSMGLAGIEAFQVSPMPVANATLHVPGSLHHLREQGGEWRRLIGLVNVLFFSCQSVWVDGVS